MNVQPDITFISKIPPVDVLRAFAVLEHDINFGRVLRWLADCAVNEAMKNIYEEKDKRKFWSDGRAQCIQYFLNHVKKARTLLDQQSATIQNEESKKAGAF